MRPSPREPPAAVIAATPDGAILAEPERLEAGAWYRRDWLGASRSAARIGQHGNVVWRHAAGRLIGAEFGRPGRQLSKD